MHRNGAHVIDTCWCKGTKHEIFPNLIIEHRTVEHSGFASREDFYRYISSLDCYDKSCFYHEPHKHGFGCDVTCLTCVNLTKNGV